MNYLIFSDLHITQDSLEECKAILEEINMLIIKHNVDTVINLGDTFDNLKPTSKELDLFATFIKQLNKKIIILAADSHESETHSISIINHFGILNEMVQIVKEFKDGNHLYCGHFILSESDKNYDARLSKNDFKGYTYVFLGHQHNYQLIKPNICHIGSTRFVDFSEAQNKTKIVCLITDYNEEKEQVQFLKLKSPIPMEEIELSKNEQFKGVSTDDSTKNRGSISQLKGKNTLNLSQCLGYLDKLNPKTKVKIKIKDFDSYKMFLSLEYKYKQKFVKFIRENDFELISENTSKSVKTEISLKSSFEQFAQEYQIDNEIKNILLKELK